MFQLTLLRIVDSHAHVHVDDEIFLHVDGTDEASEGTWLFTSRPDETPFLSWREDATYDSNPSKNCLALTLQTADQQMTDINCAFTFGTAPVPCETESE